MNKEYGTYERFEYNTAPLWKPWGLFRVMLWIFLAILMGLVGVAVLSAVAMIVSWLLPILVAVVIGAVKALVVGVAVALPAVLF